jgi:demethylmenaquinone methyltransferase/2-methoxy-6-polyprenyl-1,4-benzoquinol methylase
VIFRATFNCLWCGRPHQTRTPDDIEGYALLCPDCIGRAQDNEFLRFRLREGLRARSGSEAAPASPVQPDPVRPDPVRPDSDSDEVLRAYYAARAPEYDDWYLRRGRYSHGALADMAWSSDLDAATMWLDGLPIQGEIVELAAGTGWWSPLLAQKGQLSIYDAVEEPLDRARDRLLAHGLAAHIHVRDAWAEPDRPVDALFTGFWLSHVPRQRLSEFLALARRWLKAGGVYAFIDSRLDPQSSARDHPPPAEDMSVRRLADGREFTIPKIYYAPDELESALREAGFSAAEVTTTSRFFLLGRATV